MELKDKKLLIITGRYPPKDGKIPTFTFIKNRVDELRYYFKKIIIIAPTGYFPNFLANIKIFPSSYRDNTQFKSYKYYNVEVYFPKFFNLPWEFFIKRSGDWVYLFVKRFIKTRKITFDLIHAHFTWPSGYLAMKLSTLTKKPYVLTIQENMNWFLNIYYSNREKYYKIWKNAETLIRVNKKDIPLLKNFNKNTLSIPNGYNAEIFKKMKKEYCRKKLDIPNKNKVILNVGSYNQHQKNQLSIIRACKLLKNEIEDFLCYLIGTGRDRNLFQKEIEKLKIQKNVKLIGRQPYRAIPIWMNAADLFVFPSYAEGNPTVLVEAMACGLPFIGSLGGGMDEIIIEGETGYILRDQEDEDEISNTILKCLSKNWNTNKILDEAKKYSQKNLVKSLLKIYSNVLNIKN